MIQFLWPYVRVDIYGQHRRSKSPAQFSSPRSRREISQGFDSEAKASRGTRSRLRRVPEPLSPSARSGSQHDDDIQQRRRQKQREREERREDALVAERLASNSLQAITNRAKALSLDELANSPTASALF